MEKLREAGYFALRFVTMVKDVNMQYNNNFGSTVPGFMGEARVVGLDPSNYWNPGIAYVLGSTESIVDDLLRNDLLSHDTLMNTPHWTNQNSVFNMTANLEPIREMKVTLNATQNYTSREEFYYKYSSATDRVEGPLSYTMGGSYTTTTWSFRTMFRNSDDLFNEFLDNRTLVAARLASMNPDPYTDELVLDTMNGLYFPAGYSANQQSVLLTSFLATYLGDDPAKRNFSPFLRFPLPNWNISYNGLGKLEVMKKWFTSISISHKYSSTYSVGNFYTDAAISAAMDDYDYGMETVLNNVGDYIAPVSMEGVQINEQFNPLIRLGVNMVNSFQLNLSIQKSRILQLSFGNNQLTESTREGVTFGGGYRIKDLEIKIKTAEKTYNLKSDLVLQLNLTYNNNMTMIRKINQSGVSQVSNGSQVWMAEISAEYAVSNSITMRAFFQTNINKPHITNSYPNSTTKGGITMRFSF